jgi:anti-sigma factor RsiW
MMTCDDARARLSAWLDGEASAHDEDMRAHLSTCKRCRARADALRRISCALRDPIAPPGLEDAALRRIRVAERRPRASAYVRALSIAAVLLAALLWAAVIVRTRDEAAPGPYVSVVASLTGLERRVLSGPPPSSDEWMTIILSGGLLK